MRAFFLAGFTLILLKCAVIPAIKSIEAPIRWQLPARALRPWLAETTKEVMA
jgi:hypothetical protein